MATRPPALELKTDSFYLLEEVSYTYCLIEDKSTAIKQVP